MVNPGLPISLAHSGPDRGLAVDQRRIGWKPGGIIGVVGNRTVNIICLRSFKCRAICLSDSTLVKSTRICRFLLTPGAAKGRECQHQHGSIMGHEAPLKARLGKSTPRPKRGLESHAFG